MLTTSELTDAINRARSGDRKVASNHYASPASMPDALWDAAISEYSIRIFADEPGARRLYFYTSDFRDLAELLAGTDRELTTEIISRDPEGYEDELTRIGFSRLARMRRMSCADISVVCDRFEGSVDAPPLKAALSDTEEINALLWRVFDTRISHLPADDALAASIRRGEVLIRKRDGCITTVLQRTLHPKRFYISQVCNEGPKEDIHSMMRHELRAFRDQGGRYVYAWVQDTNTAAVRFHERYGLAPDGLWTVVYVRAPDV